MEKITIGNNALFSIRLETDRHFASVSIFCESEEMGNSDEYTLLELFTTLLEGKICRYDYILAKEINCFDKESVYSYIVEGYKKSENWRESQRLASIWITLDLTPCFDGEVFLLLSTNEFDRVIWKKFNSEGIRETFLPAGYVVKQLKLLFNSFSR